MLALAILGLDWSMDESVIVDLTSILAASKQEIRSVVLLVQEMSPRSVELAIV